MATTSLNLMIGKTYKDGKTDIEAGKGSHVTLTWDTTTVTHRNQLRDALATFLFQINAGAGNGLAE